MKVRLVWVRIKDGLMMLNVLIVTVDFVYAKRFFMTIRFWIMSMLQYKGSSTVQDDKGENHVL